MHPLTRYKGLAVLWCHLEECRFVFYGVQVKRICSITSKINENCSSHEEDWDEAVGVFQSSQAPLREAIASAFEARPFPHCHHEISININSEHHNSTKMFSTLPPLVHASYNHHTYTPARPSPLSSSPLRHSPTSSPLSPRDANVPSSSPSQMHVEKSLGSVERMETENAGGVGMISPTPTPRMKKWSTVTRTPSSAASSTFSCNTASTPKTSSSMTSTSGGSGRESVYSKRQTKKNPILRSAEDGRETRRKLFLKRVKEERDERRFGGRGDEEMMRRIWVAESRRWDESLRREGDAEILAEEAMDEGDVEEDAGIVDEVLQWEERELEAYLEMAEDQNQAQRMDDGMDPVEVGHETPYGSDEEEYDDIFMDVIQAEQKVSQSSVSHSQVEQLDTEMDMS